MFVSFHLLLRVEMKSESAFQGRDSSISTPKHLINIVVTGILDGVKCILINDSGHIYKAVNITFDRLVLCTSPLNLGQL